MSDNRMAHSPRLRSGRGFTLIELAVVLAVLGILVALLLPAVQQARESSRQVECRSHLRQLALAVHQYHDTNGCFPPRNIQTDRTHARGWGWAVRLLPYLDQQPLYDLLDPGNPPRFKKHFLENGVIRPGGDTRLPVFRCPSSGLPEVVEDVGPESPQPWELGYAVTDYKVNKNPRLFPFVWFSRSYPLPTMAGITDGASQTIAIGESSTPGQFGNKWPTWVGQTYHFDGRGFSGFMRPDVRSRSGQWWTGVSSSAPISYHPGGVNFAFLDGSVHFLPDTIDEWTFRWLCRPNDGNIVGEF